MPIGGDNRTITLITQISHASGQWIRSQFTMLPTKFDPQAYGSALTYCRRYALSAMCGVAAVDDDGNAASAEYTGGQQMDDRVIVDPEKVAGLVTQATAIVDDDDEASGAKLARELYEPLENDVRIALQAGLKANKIPGTRKTYWGAFHQWLKMAAE